MDFNNDEDQTSKLKEVELNDDSDCGYGDNSEVENGILRFICQT